MPGFIDTTPLYRPLDGDFGFRLGSFGGFEASADIAFRVSLNERTGGWYTAFLSPLRHGPGYVRRGIRRGYAGALRHAVR